MNYPLIAFLVSFVTVFVMPMIGTVISKNSDGKATAINCFIASLVYFVILWIWLWGESGGFYGPTPYFFPISIGLIIGAVVAGLTNNDFALPSITPVILVIIYIVAAGGVSFFSTDMFKANDKMRLIGDVKIIEDVSSTLQPADPAHICLVSDTMAENNVHAALSQFKVKDNVIAGSRYAIGRGVKQFVDGQLWWIFPVEFQDDYFKWKQDKQVPGFLRVSAEDPQANPQAVQYNKQGEEIHIKYLNSACYEYQAERYLRHQGYFTSILDEFTFEVDDNWNPYYVVSVIERTTGYGGYRYQGIVLMDLQTGKNEFITKEDLDLNPKWHWIDRGAPTDVLKYQVGKWGEYANSTWGYNFWHNDKSQQSGGDWYLVYSGNRCYFLTDMTSKNKDNALTGFMISEGASGKTIFYKAVGVTAKNASLAALALWGNYPGTSVAELVPYNIDGHMTYVAPMIKNKQYMGVSLVCMYDKNICAMGTTFDRALAKYRMSIDNAGHNRTVPNGGEETKKLEIVGEIGEVGMPVIIDQQQYFFFTIKNIDKSFEIPYSNSSLAVPYLKSGKQVRLTYTETNEPVIICDELEIVGLNFSDKNPAQARYLSNQELVKKEVGRVDKIQQTQELINSDQMKSVDPAALKEFLKSQKK